MRSATRSVICFPPTALVNERYIRIGAHTMIGPHVTLSAGMVPGQRCLTDPVVSIGDRCLIGQGSGIVGHLSIVIEDDVWTGHHVYITDQNHGYDDLSVPISQQSMPEMPVRIGAGSWLGHGTVVLPGSDDRQTRRGRREQRGARRHPRPLRRGRQPCPRRQAPPLTLLGSRSWRPSSSKARQLARSWGGAQLGMLVVAGELLELLADRDAVDCGLGERLVLAVAQARR